MVKAFQFRLTKVQRLRERVEKQARRTLGLATARLAAARQDLANATAMREAMAAESALLVTTGKVAAMPLQRALLAAAERSREAAVVEVDKYTGEVESARQAWQEARREVRSLELLRQRQHEKWKLQVLADEAREMDEIGRVRYLRQRGEER